MIRKLGEQDRESVLQYLGKEPALNAYLIADVENFGFSGPYLEVWAGVDNEGAYNVVLQKVILRFDNYFIMYAPGEFDYAGVIQVINDHPDIHAVSGQADTIERTAKWIPLTGLRRMFYAQLSDDKKLSVDTGTYHVKIATVEDAERIYQLKDKLEEFGGPSHREMIPVVRDIITSSGRTYYIEIDGEIVSCASTNAEGSENVLVVGVCTKSTERGKGMTTAIMTALCRDILAEGKKLCLLYDDPTAGNIYKRMGFNDIGEWIHAGR